MDIEGQELGAFTPVPDASVLAAVERAERHAGKRVPHRSIAAHLGFLHNGATTRRLRPQLESLRAAGSLESHRKFGKDVWTLTATGRRRLAAAHRAGKVRGLPESPQHRKWRHAREEADKRIIEFRELAMDTVKDADRLLTQAREPGSEKWFELSERFRWEFWRLGSATYCLAEWAEPDDARVDEDESAEPGHVGRRNTPIWDQFELDSKGG